MRYTVGELIDDKELRKELTEGTFYFTDRDGSFQEVDFAKQSMRHNHICVFEELYCIGGDALFERLIDQGNTCLTKDPNAAKVGVQAIAGAEGYYLKTNASFAVAFASILNGLAGLEDEERFFFDTEEDSDVFAFYADEAYCYTNCAFVDSACAIEEAEDGSFLVVNPDIDEQISFFIKSEDGELRIDSFYKIEKIECANYNPEDAFEDDDSYDDDFKMQKTAPVVYKYKLDENGDWGYFNSVVSQITPPKFETVELTYHNEKFHIIALESYGFQYRVYTDLYNSNISAGEMELNTSQFFLIDEEQLPGRDAYVDQYADSEGNGIILYYPDRTFGEGMVVLNCNGNSYDEYTAPCGKKPYIVKLENGFITGEESSVKIPVCFLGTTLYAKDCYHLYFGDCPEYEIIRTVDDLYYILYKEGYYAIALYKMNTKCYASGKELDRFLTPFAFTGIKTIGDYILVDRFGKKGVFSPVLREYIIPCDYDSIKLNEDGNFEVEKGGFKGVVSTTGTSMVWKEKLHRED